MPVTIWSARLGVAFRDQGEAGEQAHKLGLAVRVRLGEHRLDLAAHRPEAHVVGRRDLLQALAAEQAAPGRHTGVEAAPDRSPNETPTNPDGSTGSACSALTAPGLLTQPRSMCDAIPPARLGPVRA